MWLEKINLINFRNQKEKQLEFAQGVNIIVGPNGIGKTNILEGIHYLSTATSFKANQDREIILYESNFCTLSGLILSQGGEKQQLDLSLEKKDDTNRTVKIAKWNKVSKAIYKYTELFHTVIFTPQDLQLLTDSPAKRRKYLDDLLKQTDSKYKKGVGDYQKTIRQKNKVLEIIRETGRGEDQLDFWNKKILELGSYIQKQRKEFFEEIQEIFKEKIAEINGKNTESEIVYVRKDLTKDLLEDYARAERASCRCLVGPHRDDFYINYKQHPIAEYGSRGEQRNAILALKMAEIAYIENKTGIKPILLLDDIFSEFDQPHRKNVVRMIKNQQTIVTTTDIEEEYQTTNPNIIEML